MGYCGAGLPVQSNPKETLTAAYLNMKETGLVE